MGQSRLQKVASSTLPRGGMGVGEMYEGGQKDALGFGSDGRGQHCRWQHAQEKGIPSHVIVKAEAAMQAGLLCFLRPHGRLKLGRPADMTAPRPSPWYHTGLSVQ